MADITKEQEARFNQAAGQWLGGHARNFRRSMNPRNKEPMEQVQPWGEARAAALNQPTAIAATAGAPGAAAVNVQTLVPARVKQKPEPSVTGAQDAATNLAGSNAQAATTQETGPPVAARLQGFRSTLANGLTVGGDVQGNKTYTMGTPGQDGYGVMTVRGGQNAMGGQARTQETPEAFLTDVARQNLQGRGQAGGYSFQGGGADFAKFAQQPTRPSMQDGNTVANERPAYLQVRDRYEAGGGMEKPKYLGPESGLGWKTRLAKYNAELDAYENMTGQRNAMDIAAMREAGAGRQSLLQARGVNDANAIAAARLADDQGVNALDMQAKQLEIQSAQQRQEIIKRLDTTTDPNERRALQGQLLAMQGKDPAQKYQVVTREGFDPVTNMPTKTPYAVNQDDPTQSFEIRGQGGQQPDAMGVINGNPAYAKAYSAASPEQQAEMLKKVRERLAQKGGL